MIESILSFAILCCYGHVGHYDQGKCKKWLVQATQRCSKIIGENVVSLQTIYNNGVIKKVKIFNVQPIT